MSEILSTCLAVFFLLFSPAPPNTPPTLVVAAASDLSSIGPELTAAFTRHHPGLSVKLVNGASAMLRQQIENGAPYDVFLSANAAYVDGLASAKLVLPDSVSTYAHGRVGVAWRDGKKHPLRDLATSPIQIVALPNPKLAPYGVAAQQALEYGGLWSLVQPKVIYGENVRQTLQYLESGNADAVLTSDALLQGRPDVEVLPAEWHQPIVQKGGIVAASHNQTLGRQFIQFLLGSEGQAIFARFGFSPPDTDNH